MSWEVVYERAIRDDGSLFFPQRLDKEFLDNAKKVMGSYMFANQYQNEVIPLDQQVFKPEWKRYYTQLPKTYNTFVTIDPAISLEETADYTGVCVLHVDSDQNWYLAMAARYRVTPTSLMDLIFRLHKQFSPKVIGIEDVMYQKALLYMLDEEMRRRNQLLPVKGIRPEHNKAKDLRILSLVPRFEFNRIQIAKGMTDFEEEFAKFPRGTHDDILDSLAYCEKVVFYPEKEKPSNVQPPPNHPDYEKWYIRNKYSESRNSQPIDSE